MKIVSKFHWLIIAYSLLAAASCSSQPEEKRQEAPVKVSLATVATTYSGLVAIAEVKGYFQEEGLDLLMQEYPSGLATQEALCRGEVDLATGADIAFTTLIRSDPSLRILASIASTNSNEIVVRKDRGIEKQADLRGKRIGFHRNTTSDYYLDAFLATNAIARSEVTPVGISPTKAAEALASGEVDAVSTWGVYVFEAKRRLADNALSWQSQNSQEYHWLLVGKHDQAREAAKLVIKALRRAEDFVQKQPVEAKAILMRKWGLDPAFIEQFWERARLRVTLDQSLIMSLDAFARWERKKSGDASELPNLLEYIDMRVLEEIAPKSITIFR